MEQWIVAWPLIVKAAYIALMGLFFLTVIAYMIDQRDWRMGTPILFALIALSVYMYVEQRNAAVCLVVALVMTYLYARIGDERREQEIMNPRDKSKRK